MVTFSSAKPHPSPESGFFCRLNSETGSSLLARPFIGSSERFGPLTSHFFFLCEVEGAQFCKDAACQGANANEQHESSSLIAPIPPCAAHVCDHSSSRFEREKLLTVCIVFGSFAKNGTFTSIRPGNNEFKYVNRWDKGAAAKERDQGREGSGKVKETDGKREEIKNFTWVLYDREKNTRSGPPPISAIQIPALSRPLFSFFLTTILSFLPQTPPSPPLPACLPACLPCRSSTAAKILPASVLVAPLGDPSFPRDRPSPSRPRLLPQRP